MSIKLEPTDSSLNTHPAVSFNYDDIPCYFSKFLPKFTGIKYSYYSTKPCITIKQNSKLRDINQFYSSNFVIIKKIHDFDLVNTIDLEMIIEHIPDPTNTNQHNLYTCFPFTDVSGGISNGFETLFSYINTDNINATTTDLTNATTDQLKKSKLNIGLTSGININLSGPSIQPIRPNAYYYLDNSMNIFIVFNNPIKINAKKAPSYILLRNLFQPIESDKIFDETDCKINTDTGGLVKLDKFSSEPIGEPFATLSEGFAILRNHLSIIEGTTTMTTGNTSVSGNTLMEKYVYCRPADSSNSDKLLTTTINASANVKKDSILLNDVMMIFIIMIIFIFMCVLSPSVFFTMNKNVTKYDTGTMFWALRIVAFVIIFCGGFFTIVVSRTVPNTPEWLPLLGLIVVMCYILFYLVVYSFQKNMIYTQLSDIVEETFEENDKEQIKKFRNYLFGEVI